MSHAGTGLDARRGNESDSAPKTSVLRRLHHYAFPVADQEVTRHFMEDLLGVPLKATWAEQDESHGEDPAGEALPEEWGITEPGTYFCHTFYEMADGAAIAFFQFAGVDKNLIGRTNIYAHVALETDQAGQDAIHQRLLAAGVEHHVIHHGYVTSLYGARRPVPLAVGRPHHEQLLARDVGTTGRLPRTSLYQHAPR
jgi:catechol 2,3-dioxygenase-like lactoylglutathione lyase family enzyme